jgi:hypothetical protein
LGKLPAELRGLSNGQIDWLYECIVDKFSRQAEVLRGADGALVFDSQPQG